MTSPAVAVIDLNTVGPTTIESVVIPLIAAIGAVIIALLLLIFIAFCVFCIWNSKKSNKIVAQVKIKNIVIDYGHNINFFTIEHSPLKEEIEHLLLPMILKAFMYQKIIPTQSPLASWLNQGE